jgi:hypothetical protein
MQGPDSNMFRYLLPSMFASSSGDGRLLLLGRLTLDSIEPIAEARRIYERNTTGRIENDNRHTGRNHDAEFGRDSHSVPSKSNHVKKWLSVWMVGTSEPDTSGRNATLRSLPAS